MKDVSDEELSSMTTPFPEHKKIEVKDFIKLKKEGKCKKDVLYIVHIGKKEGGKR